MEVKEYNMRMRVVRQIHYNSDSLFGIYAVVPVDYNRELVLNRFYNVSIQGTTRKLSENESYDIKFEGTYSHAKYGDFYKIIEVEPEKLDSVIAHDRFLKAVLTENQFNSLKDAYPDDMLVDLILEDKIDVSLTKGIKEKSLATIKETVQKNSHLSTLISRLNGLGLTTNAIGRLLEHFGSSEKCVQAIDDNIYGLCQIPSFGFHTIDKIALGRGDNPTNEQRIKACIEFLINRDLSDGHTWSPLDELVEDATEMLNINKSMIWNMISELERDVEFYVSDTRIAMSYARNMEISAYKHLKRIRDSYIAPNVDGIDARVQRVEDEQGFKFTEEQREAIISGSQHGVIIVNGLAGSGKTATVKGLIDSLGVDDFMTCALSGSAVRVLSERGIKASTIHRMLGYRDGGFEHDELNPLPHRLVVMDEMSMIDIPLLLSTIQAIPEGSKLILVGDSGQLPPISFGHPLEDLLGVETFPSYELTQVHRQAQKSGILTLANSIRAGIQPMPYNSSGVEVYGELKDQTLMGYSKSDKGNIPYDVLRIAEGYKRDHVKTPQDLVDFQVIVPNRERGDLSVRSMNVELQQIFNDINKPYLSRNNYDFREGDKVILRGNSYKKPFFYNTQQFADYLKLVEMVGEEEASESMQNEVNAYNGTMGFISGIVKKHILIQFDGIDGLIPFEQNDDMDKIELGYAATIHQLQGTGIKNIVICADFAAFTLLSKQLFYTAITRGVLKSVLLVETNALHKAVGNDVSGARRTFLAEIAEVDIN